MPAADRSDPRTGDALSRPASVILWWGLPLALGWGADLIHPAAPFGPLAWSGALAWMGLGCALNARRCHRLHCYLSAPVLFAGAAAVALVGLGLTPLRPEALTYLIDGALGLALLSFGSELILGKYVRG